jgi:hypothetical protein
MTATRLAIVLGLLGVPAVAAARPWSITPPEGWVDVTEAANALPEIQASKQRLAAIASTIEIVQYAGPDDQSLQVLFIVMPPGRAHRGSPVHESEAGTRRGAGRSADRELSYVARDEADAVVSDQVLAVGDLELHIRRIAGMNAAGEVVAVSATCGGDPACAAAVRSVRLARAGFQPLSATRAAAGERGSVAYRAGYAVGIALCIALAIWLVVRRRRA